MVTGVETAGLVLGSIPLVVSGLEHYADGVSTITKWWRYKRELSSLVRVLDAEYARFLGTCEILLQDLIPPNDLKWLLENPQSSQWNDKSLDQKLKMRLGRSYSPYMNSVEDMASAVEVLKAKLELDVDGNIKWGDYGTFKHEYKRVKFSLSRRQYEESMRKIKDGNDLLANLTDQNIELEPSRKRRRRSNVQFEAIQEHARNLYNVINRSCTCNQLHRANLRLDARIFDDESVQSSVDAEQAANVRFQVVFLLKNPQWPFDSSLLWQETEIRLLDSKTDQGCARNGKVIQHSQSSSILSGHSHTDMQPQLEIGSTAAKASKLTIRRKKGVRFAEVSSVSIPPGLLVSEKDLGELAQIEHVCNAIRQSMNIQSHSQRCLGYLSNEGRTRLGVYLPQLPLHLPIPPSQKSLADLLSSNPSRSNRLNTAAGNLPLCRGDRLKLALTVASSVLQLYKTPWLQELFHTSDIIISEENVTNIRQHVYVSKDFPEPSSASVQTQTQLIYPLRNVTLFALGRVLTELCLGQPLEALRSPADPLGIDGKANVLTDWSTANRLIEAVYSEAGTRYGDAVRRCLYCDFNERHTSLDDHSFRQVVYDGVVAPLEDDVKDFYQR